MRRCRPRADSATSWGYPGRRTTDSRIRPVAALRRSSGSEAPSRRRGPNPRRRTELGLLLFGSLIVAAFYVIASIGTTSRIPPDLGAFLAIVLGLSAFAHIANRLLVPDGNAVLLPLATLLNGLGYVMIARINPHY